MKNINLIRLIASIGIICLLMSCTGNVSLVPVETTGHKADIGITAENGRLVFKNITVLRKTLAELSKFTKEQEFANWESKFMYKSLRSQKTGESTENSAGAFISPNLESVLNQNGEYVVGDKIVWKSNGYTHIIDNLDEVVLLSIKQNPNSDKSAIKDQISNIDGKPSDAESNGYMGLNDLKADYQKIWGYNGVNDKWRKTIYELVSAASAIGSDGGGVTFYDYSVLLRIKLEYYDSRGKLHPAGDTRLIDRVYLTGYFRDPSQTYPVSINRYSETRNSDLVLTLVYSNTAVYYTNSTPLEYSLSGEISTRGYIGNDLIVWSGYTVSGNLW
jgi:hypothetical protein